MAVCKVALRSRERLAALRPHNGIPVLHTLHWPEEIRDPGDLASPAPTTDREPPLTELLMDEMAGVDIGELHDDYAQALNVLTDTLAADGGALPAAGGPDSRAEGIRSRRPACPYRTPQLTAREGASAERARVDSDIDWTGTCEELSG
ncbi:Ku protein [Streptomyces platensis]|uniref:Ku protein n=1 Tax=Streptomyces platensis TaxID=58346 RepID=UPI0037996B6C